MLKDIFITLLTWVCVFLAGCSFTPKYQEPQAPIPDKLPQGGAYKDSYDLSNELMVHELNWQDFFTDSKLKKVIEIALTNNRDLKLAALNVEKARAMYGIQRAELFPALDVTASGGKERRSKDLISTGEPRTVEQYNVDLGIASWEIDFFGRLRSLKDRALEEYLATDQARRSAQIALVSETAIVYLTLAADRENLKLARSTLKSQQDSYNLILKSYKIGLSTDIDLKRAQTQVDAAQRDVPHYMQLAAQDQNALNLLAGTTVPYELLPVDFSRVIPPKAISPGISSEILLNRPDIIAAEHRLKASYAYIGAARAAFFPRISLTTSVGTASDDLSGLFSGSESGTWSFFPQISMPIFDARIWAALRVSKAERKIILTEYEKAIQTAFREIADALAVHGTINQQVSAQQSLVDATAATYRLSKKRYNFGIDDYLSVLDAHRSLYAQQQALISLRLIRDANQVKLYAVLGGGGNE